MARVVGRGTPGGALGRDFDAVLDSSPWADRGLWCPADAATQADGIISSSTKPIDVLRSLEANTAWFKAVSTTGDGASSADDFLVRLSARAEAVLRYLVDEQVPQWHGVTCGSVIVSGRGVVPPGHAGPAAFPVAARGVRECQGLLALPMSQHWSRTSCVDVLKLLSVYGVS